MSQVFHYYLVTSKNRLWSKNDNLGRSSQNDSSVEGKDHKIYKMRGFLFVVTGWVVNMHRQYALRPKKL